MKKTIKIILIGITTFVSLLLLFLAFSSLVYSPDYVIRLLKWRESDVGDYLHNFPQRSLKAAADPFYFEVALEEENVASDFEQILAVDDFTAFLGETNTQAFIVIQNDKVIYEKYLNGAQTETLATSFSMAKSFTSALIGIAIAEGFISDIDDPITEYLPELAARDIRFRDITVRHLLRMASGLDYQANRSWLFNGDDPLTTYFPNQRQAALEFTKIVGLPGETFSYNKYHPQLLGLILERTTDVPVTEYLQEKIWDPIGMEFDGSWSLDSESSGFEKMETGINARPIDFAKFGRLYLENGNWNGTQVIPEQWVEESIQVDDKTQTDHYYQDDYGQAIFREGNGYYQYMWYGVFFENGAFDFYAEGDRGQFIYVSPQSNLIIVRNGFEYGIQPFEWVDTFKEFAVGLHQ